jgi:hypothetical protein
MQRQTLRRRLQRHGIEVHPESWVDLADLASEGPYRKTFAFAGDYADANHAAIGHAPGGRMGIPFCLDLGIDGYLQRGDALKLYELALFTSGDVLELGTHYGLSTSLIAKALDARGSGRLETVDTNAETTAVAIANLKGLPGRSRVTFTVSDATKRMEALVAAGRKYSFIFVDHWHGYQATLDAALLAPKLLERGGFIQFHDFLNPENMDPADFQSVFQAVLDSACLDKRFLFCGNYGCTGVFRFV